MCTSQLNPYKTLQSYEVIKCRLAIEYFTFDDNNLEIKNYFTNYLKGIVGNILITYLFQIFSELYFHR